MTAPGRAQLAAGFALLVAMAVYSARHLRLASDITHFLPADADARLAYASRAVATSDLSRTLVLAVTGDDPARVVPAAQALATRLRAHPEVAWLRSGVDPSLESALHASYFPRRHAFLSDAPETELPARLRDAGLTEAARALRRQLASPTGPLVARLAGDDPLLGFIGHLTRLRAAQDATLTVRDGQFASADGRHAVMFLATRRSAFDAPAQRPFLAALDRTFHDIARAQGGGLRLLRSGAHPVSVAAEAQIRGDAERISALGSLGVAALFLLIHRSLRYLLLASLPIVAGTLLGTTAGLLLFGSLHGLTFAFGASLIGVCFDYPVYLINHHTLNPAPQGPAATLARVWAGLRLGALTTVGGLVGMALTSFPAMREIAVFSAFGVIGALLSTRYLVTPLLPRAPIPVTFQRRLADAIARAVAAQRARGAAPWAIPLLALALCAVGLPRLRWEDDARALTAVDPALAREEREVARVVSRLDEGRFVVATGSSDEEALRRNDLVASRLESLRRAGVLARYRSLHAMVWSADLQRRNESALRADPSLARRLDAAFAREGFRAGAFAGFARALAAPPPAPLTWHALMASPAADLVRPFRVPVGGRVGYLTFLGGVRDLPAVTAALRDIPGVDAFDQRTFLRETYARYRRRTMHVIAAGLVAVLAMLFARYRRAGVALAALAPAVLASAASMGAVGVMGAPANLMHLLGVLMVLSVGADYGIFVAEIDRHPEAARETLLSVSVAWVTTLLSFGLLALSSSPPLRAIGLTTGIGITLSWLLAPLSRHLLAGGRKLE